MLRALQIHNIRHKYFRNHILLIKWIPRAEFKKNDREFLNSEVTDIFRWKKKSTSCFALRWKLNLLCTFRHKYHVHNNFCNKSKHVWEFYWRQVSKVTQKFVATFLRPKFQNSSSKRAMTFFFWFQRPPNFLFPLLIPCVIEIMMPKSFCQSSFSPILQHC